VEERRFSKALKLHLYLRFKKGVATNSFGQQFFVLNKNFSRSQQQANILFFNSCNPHIMKPTISQSLSNRIHSRSSSIFLLY
jgi:hypothetical protein